MKRFLLLGLLAILVSLAEHPERNESSLRPLETRQEGTAKPKVAVNWDWDPDQIYRLTHRAYYLSVTDCILPEEGIAPDMRVDVFVVIGGRECGPKNLPLAEIVPAQPGKEPNDPAMPPALFLVVTPEEAQRLTLMKQQCKLIVRPTNQIAPPR
jgi:hypothetical protein